MEVCQKRVHRAKSIAGINEKFCVATLSPDTAIGIGCALQRPRSRRAGGHDARAREFRPINRFGRLSDYFIILGSDGMFFDYIDAYGLESRIADMMGDLNDLHAASAQFAEGTRGEM